MDYENDGEIDGIWFIKVIVMKCDIFISYRRSDGTDIARSVEQALKARGYQNIFYDYTSLRDGVFNEKIIDAINQCNDYILLLTPHALDRCAEEGNWVAREIETAIQAGCQFIPLAVNENYARFPSDFPKRLRIIQNIQQTLLLNNEYFEDSITHLTERLTSIPQKLITSDDCQLSISTDETSQLFIDDTFISKIKEGKQATVKELEKGKTYHIKLVNLGRKGVELVTDWVATESGTLRMSFTEERERQQQQIEQQRATTARAKEQARQLQGKLMQASENYDKVWKLKYGMVAVSLKEKIGFLNESGFEAVTCEYDDATDFQGDYCSVCKNGNWGVIDKFGQVVVPLQSETPCWLHHACYFVASRNSHFAISTIKRGFPNSFPYEEVTILNDFNDLFAVKTGGLWRIIDATGADSPFTLQVKSIGERYSLQSFRRKWEGVYTYTPLRVQHPGTQRWGYLNHQLKLTVPFVDEGSGEDVNMPNLEIIKTNKRMGLVNVETGDFIIPTIYGNIRHFYQDDNYDFFRVADDSTPSNCRINQQGNVISEDTHQLWGGKQGIVDTNGSMIVPQHYQFLLTMTLYKHDDLVPFFLGYLLKDLKLSWGKPLLGDMYLDKSFNKQLSAIHIYAPDGSIIKKVNYRDDSQIRNIIYEEMDKVL